MSVLEDREKAEEAKFAHDSELRFRAEARRNKLLGLWAAQLMGIASDEEQLTYAFEVVKADFEKSGDDDVFSKVQSDLHAAGVEIAEEVIRAKMTKFLGVAREQLLSGD